MSRTYRRLSRSAYNRVRNFPLYCELEDRYAYLASRGEYKGQSKDAIFYHLFYAFHGDGGRGYNIPHGYRNERERMYRQHIRQRIHRFMRGHDEDVFCRHKRESAAWYYW